MVQAAIYTRISSDRDDDRQGVDAQEEDCRRLCERLGWEVAEVYCDNDISAADPRKRRDRYQQMLRDIAARKVDALAVAKADRLHRRPSELEEFFKLLWSIIWRLLFGFLDYFANLAGGFVKCRFEFFHVVFYYLTVFEKRINA